MKRTKEKVKEALKVGYVRVYRNLTHWEWYTDIPCKVLYLHCIMEANYTPKKWQGKIIKQGSFITSLSKLADSTGLTIRQVRTALNKLKSTNDLTHKTTNNYTVINVCNYCDWQNPEEENDTQNDTRNDKQMTNERQTDDNQMSTTNKANKANNIERENRENFEILIKYAELKGVKSPTAYASKVIKETSEENLKNVIENLQKEIQKIAEKNAKREKMKEEEKKELSPENSTVKAIEEYTDEEIAAIIATDKKYKKSSFKNPFIETVKKEAIKRGLAI